MLPRTRLLVDAGTDLPIEDRVDADELWDREWTRSLITRALTAIKDGGNQSEQSWKAFDLYSRRGVPVDEVAERLGTGPEAIRQARSRIGRQVRNEIERIRSEEGRATSRSLEFPFQLRMLHARFLEDHVLRGKHQFQPEAGGQEKHRNRQQGRLDEADHDRDHEVQVLNGRHSTVTAGDSPGFDHRQSCDDRCNILPCG